MTNNKLCYFREERQWEKWAFGFPKGNACFKIDCFSSPSNLLIFSFNWAALWEDQISVTLAILFNKICGKMISLERKIYEIENNFASIMEIVWHWVRNKHIMKFYLSCCERPSQLYFWIESHLFSTRTSGCSQANLNSKQIMPVSHEAPCLAQHCFFSIIMYFFVSLQFLHFQSQSFLLTFSSFW